MSTKPAPMAAEYVQASPFEDSEQLNALRQQLLQFAQVQLNDAHLAEDAVQEALAGAMKNAESFTGKSAFKTWVFAILKNKIIDIIRKRQRNQEISEQSLIDDQETIDNLFDQRRHWHPNTRPQHWDDPEHSFKQEQFWVVLETCLNELPGTQARAFMLREYIGLSSQEICDELEISVSNLHVLLHRARLRLQRCINTCWLEGSAHA